ncbi:MAG: acyl-CoA dehydrogenase family protein [Parvibaculaceae bacterium]
METQEGYCPVLWRSIADLGLTGLLIDEAYGGSNGGYAALERIMEEAGAALLLGPFFSSSVLSASLVSQVADEPFKQDILPKIVSGDLIVSSALTDSRGIWTEEGVSVDAAQSGDCWILNGASHFVLDAGIADVLIVAAIDGDEVSLFEVNGNASGVSTEVSETWDETLRVSRVTYSDVAARKLVGTSWETCQNAINVARVALVGHQVGAARRIFDMTIDYLKTRIQFGRFIGSFQAMKHMAADLLVEVESSTSAARAAAHALDSAESDGSELLDLASFACADAFCTVAASAIQMHGGIAFTWEHPAHLYLKRARSLAYLFGSPEVHRSNYLTTLENAR